MLLLSLSRYYMRRIVVGGPLTILGRWGVLVCVGVEVVLACWRVSRPSCSVESAIHAGDGGRPSHK